MEKKLKPLPKTSLSEWNKSWARAGRNCLTASNGGEGFLFLHMLLKVQVIFLINES